MSSLNISSCQQQAYNFLVQKEYIQAAQIYEKIIEIAPEVKSNYWYLGLVLLLQGKEIEAQTTWLLAMAEGEPEQIECWTTELIDVLRIEAERQQQLENYQTSWSIRQHLREINPEDINNILQIVQLSIQLQTFVITDITELGVIELLSEKAVIHQDLLLQTLEQVLDYSTEVLLIDFAAACINQAENLSAFIEVTMLAAIRIAYSLRQPKLASQLAEVCSQKEPENQEILRHLSAFHQDAGEYNRGIEIARRCYNLADNIAEQVINNHILLRSLLSANNYEEAYSQLIDHKHLLNLLINQPNQGFSYAQTLKLFNSTFFLSYFNDEPKYNQSVRSQIGRLCQDNFEKHDQQLIAKYRHKSFSFLPYKSRVNKILKIGYISHCLKRHSVGWLSRWIFKYHNQDKFKVYAYLLGTSEPSNFSKYWFANNVEGFYGFKSNEQEVLDKIKQDEIDILVDLDSLTFDDTCEIMAIKPAPIQVTWLGWDGSGIPAIDYFIADPYVLPDVAQDYYTEKIYRLPQTYIAVDGFEVDVPTLRRDQLDIPNDAIVYYIGQKSYKLTLDHIRLQMRIIKEVPNSYLLIKGRSELEASQRFFEQVLEEVGVEYKRLRFLPFDISEGVHRANLSIADVVLDTYPYNGATTTLETLWMGIPLVTKVGQQFAARNSYTMMMNVGVHQGIAWTNEEYVEWGVRLGKDAALRQQISWRLRQSRQTAPLWNAKQFTREMEKAYEQMWQEYVGNS